jgi:hypothetical protein
MNIVVYSLHNHGMYVQHKETPEKGILQVTVIALFVDMDMFSVPFIST